MPDDFRVVGFESNLILTFEEICKNACDILGVDHSGFVRFDPLNSFGEVVAQYPSIDGLLGRTIPLKGVSAEETLLTSDEPLVIADVAKDQSLGEVKVILQQYDIRSICIVKVLFHGVIIGSFSFDSIGNVRSFTSEDLAFCKYFAELASKIIENAQFWNWLEAFQKAIGAITSERESTALLKTITKQAEELFSVQLAGLYQRGFDERGSEILKHTASSVDDLEGTFLKKGEGMAWQVLLNNKPYETTTNYDTYEHRVLSYEGRFSSVLEVPLLRQNDRIGVIYLSDGERRIFTEFDAKLLQRFADIVVITLQHCALLDRMKDLSIASADISKDFDSAKLDERLTEIAIKATNILNAEMCGVFLVEEPIMILQASFGHRENAFTPNQVFDIRDAPQSGLTGAIAARLIQRHREIRNADSENSRTDVSPLIYNACGQSLYDDLAIRNQGDSSPSGRCYSLLAIPLVTRSQGGERISGILRVTNKRGVDGLPRESICFSDEDEWVLRIFAEAVAVAIESAKLFDELSEQRELYEQLLATWNTLASDDPLETRLERVANNLVLITSKSFCRILLTGDSDEFLDLKATALRPRARSEENARWNTTHNRRLTVTDWPELRSAFQNGSPYELSLTTDALSRNTLHKLAEMLNLHTAEGGGPLPIHSLFSIPMMVGSRPIGLLSIGELRSGQERRKGNQPSDQQLGYVPRGKERRSFSSVGFTHNQKNVATAIAAQATVMIDRDWRSQTVKRREELFSRLSKALDIIRAERDSGKKLMIVPNQARLVLGCPVSGLMVQNIPGSATRLVLSSEKGLEVHDFDADQAEINDLLSHTPVIGSKAISNQFSDFHPKLLVLREYALATTLAVQFEFAAGSRCLLFVGDNSNTSELSFSDLSVLEELANHCAISLTRAAMREQLTNARDGVNQIAIDLSLGDQLQALQNVVKGIASVTGCDAVTLYTIRSADGEIKARPATYGLIDIEKPAIYVNPVFQSPVGRVLERNALYCAEDTRTNDVMKGGFAIREEIRSSAGTPVWLPDEARADSMDIESDADRNQSRKAVGVLFVNYRTPHTFTEDDKRNIKMAAHLAALAIRNHSLFSEERRKATVLNSLYEASKALSQTLDLTVILTHLAEQTFLVAQTLDRKVTHAAIKLFHDGRAKIHAGYPAIYNSAVTVGEEINLNPSGKKIGIVGRAFRTRKSEFVGDVSKDQDYRQVFADTKSQIVILIGEENNEAIVPLGAITIESPDLYAFDENDLTAFRSLAALANDAIRNAQQYSERQYALDREANLKDLALYYVKCGILIHNQKTPVLSIKTQAEILSKMSEIETGSKVSRIIEGLVQHAEELEAISSQAEPSAIQLITLDLHDFTESWHKLLRLNPNLATIPFKVTGPPQRGHNIQIDELLMRHVLKVFVDNSLKAMQGRLEKAIDIQISDWGARFCKILVSDTGKGIDKDEWQIIAAGKRPANVDQARKGLRTALLIVTGFGGEIRLAESSSAGTTFLIKLPLAAK